MSRSTQIVWVWEEDDAIVSDKERWQEALERMFRIGILSTSEKQLIKSNGDAFVYILVGRDIAIYHGYDGSKIGVLTETDAPATSRFTATEVTDTVRCVEAGSYLRFEPRETVTEDSK